MKQVRLNAVSCPQPIRALHIQGGPYFPLCRDNMSLLLFSKCNCNSTCFDFQKFPNWKDKTCVHPRYWNYGGQKLALADSLSTSAFTSLYHFNLKQFVHKLVQASDFRNIKISVINGKFPPQ